MLIPAILVSIVALLAAMDEQLFGASMMARPLFTGPIIGLIMGDLQTGVIIGATLESMFMGSIMVGSSILYFCTKIFGSNPAVAYFTNVSPFSVQSRIPIGGLSSGCITSALK